MSAASVPRQFPWVIPEYCEGCTSCIAACPRKGLAMRSIAEDEYIPWLDQPDVCTGCGRCADACAMGGIVMTEYVDEARRRFLERYADAS
jgi:NAD-dependent dihydropyrimidine dehydrogenase PreA subunit